MVYLTLKYSDTVMSRIPKFSRFLEAYNLKIVNQEINGQSTIDLSVNAELAAEAKQVSGLAYDFFDKAIISIRNQLEG